MNIIQMNTKNKSFNELLSYEWLETNGLGGYASSTVLNCHTRKYHGFLVVNLDAPCGKYVVLSKVLDTVSHENRTFELTSSQYPGVIEIGGQPFFENYQLETHPVFQYRCDLFQITKEILMPTDENTVLIKYSLHQNSNGIHAVQLRIKPFIAFRNFHTLRKKCSEIQPITTVSSTPTVLQCVFDAALPAVFFQTQQALKFDPNELWYYNFEYQKEKERGFEYLEDLFTPGEILLDLSEENDVIVRCSLNEPAVDLPNLWMREIKERKHKLLKQPKKELKSTLQHAASQFLIRKQDNTSIIAGYHWFFEWGRDAMIALPGLTLYNGDTERYLKTLHYFSAHEHLGLIPNFIDPDPSKNAYDTVDASLWFCWSVQQYYSHTQDLNAVIALWPTIINIFHHYLVGTLFDIKVQENGLIYAGDRTVKVTWMDVMIDGVPITPRNGAQVEINALWYNALCFMRDISEKINDPIKNKIDLLIPKIEHAFLNEFWNEELGYLSDFINDHHKDNRLRPNQLFAVSLPFSPLPKSIAQKVMNIVKERLLTPYGLRTLSIDDPHYQGRYEGGPNTRDLAYHNGTVWPWLLGAFGEAYLKVFGKEEALVCLTPCLMAIQEHIEDQVYLGGLSEIFDGDPPHRPNGCISQAWSVAEILRLLSLLENDAPPFLGIPE